jgi:hypothetical protein
MSDTEPLFNSPKHISYKGATDEWLTPPEILGPLGMFDLDPCAATDRPWPTALRHLTLADDGLSSPWLADELVWCNPPYSAGQTATWMDRLHDHSTNGAGGVGLVFARTDAVWFDRCVWRRASSLLFVRRRIIFRSPNGDQPGNNPGVPSVLVAYGDAAAERLRLSDIDGALIERWRRTDARPPRHGDRPRRVRPPTHHSR